MPKFIFLHFIVFIHTICYHETIYSAFRKELSAMHFVQAKGILSQNNGMNITFVTSAQTDEEGYALLKEFGLPFKNAKKD